MTKFLLKHPKLPEVSSEWEVHYEDLNPFDLETFLEGKLVNTEGMVLQQMVEKYLSEMANVLQTVSDDSEWDEFDENLLEGINLVGHVGFNHLRHKWWVSCLK